MRQAIRNYTNAIKKIGGTVVYETGGCATMKVTKNKQEIWAGVTVAAGYDERHRHNRACGNTSIQGNPKSRQSLSRR